MNPQQPPPAENNESSVGRIILISILVILLVAALIFGGWAYKNMRSYKNDSDQKAAAAVTAANKKLTNQLQAQFAQQSKSPYKVFHGSVAYGSVTFQYPKSWSAYVDTTNSSEPINGYFNPGEVPGVQSSASYALRVELVNTDYSQIIQQFNSSGISGAHVTAKAYIPPKLKGAANITPGVYYSGQINQQDPAQKGYMLVIQVRDKTLQIYTENQESQADFNDIVLKSLSFAP